MWESFWMNWERPRKGEHPRSIAKFSEHLLLYNSNQNAKKTMFPGKFKLYVRHLRLKCFTFSNNEWPTIVVMINIRIILYFWAHQESQLKWMKHPMAKRFFFSGETFCRIHCIYVYISIVYLICGLLALEMAEWDLNYNMLHTYTISYKHFS